MKTSFTFTHNDIDYKIGFITYGAGYLINNNHPYCDYCNHLDLNVKLYLYKFGDLDFYGFTTICERHYKMVSSKSDLICGIERFSEELENLRNLLIIKDIIE